MRILVLGHGRKYELNDIRCSPGTYPTDKWFYLEYTCVDKNTDVNPDIIFDLNKPWTFVQEKYDLIVDTAGCAFGGRGRYKAKFIQQILNSLAENGTFHGWSNTVITHETAMCGLVDVLC